MEMISANDLYFFPRIKNLEKEYEKCSIELENLQEEFDYLLDSETISCFALNIMSDQIQVISSLRDYLKEQIEILKLQTLN